ncbi:MAG: hypothetical protein Q7J78_03195, partial [Clostridiales bacterium]|nr:hypothetical protein [Clostridiales bacterium]
MSAFRIALRALFIRPVLMIQFTALAVIFGIIGEYNFILPLLSGMNAALKEDIWSNIISFLNLASEPGIILPILLTLAALLCAGSLLSGILLPGCLYTLSNAVEGRAGFRGEFVQGYKVYFFRLLTMTFRTLLIGFMLAGFLLVASLPAAVLTKAAVGGEIDVRIISFFVDIITITTVIFSVLVYLVYVLFWYPATFKNPLQAFKNGKTFVNR